MWEYNGLTCDNNILAHYGIKGQSWGVRRFQNEDGTLTEEGRQRYLKGLDEKRQDLYKNMTDEGRKRVDEKLSKGKDFDTATKEALQEHRSQNYKTRMGLRAAGIVSSYGTKLIGDIVAPRHPLVGAILRGWGKGAMIGNAIGAGVETIANLAAKDNIANMNISDLEIIDKKKNLAS